MTIDKAIALDVDGVLNTSYSRAHKRMGAMSPLLVRNLARICETTDASIVVSSSWRFGGIGAGSEFWTELRLACVRDQAPERLDFLMNRIIGKTLDLPGTREDEVLEFMTEFQVGRFCAVDDEPAWFPSRPPWLFLTDDDVGLDDQIADAVVKYFQNV